MAVVTEELGPELDLPSAQELFDATEHIVGQEKARKALAVLLRRQALVAQGKLDYAPGALVAGNTGVGKTMAVRAMCRVCGLPFSEANATQFSETGYIGADLAQMFLDLVKNAIELRQEELEAKYGKKLVQDILEDDRTEKGDRIHNQYYEALMEQAIEDAQTGVVFLDEFDKWVQMGQDEKGRNPGRLLMGELLQIVEGGTFKVRSSDEDEGFSFRTHKVLIIAGGAFVGLDEVISRRLQQDRSKFDQAQIWGLVMPKDIMAYGITPELTGRLSTVIPFKPLTTDDFQRIIRQEVGELQEYVQRFEAEGGRLQLDEAGITAVASIAKDRGVGARGIRQLLDSLLVEPLFEVATGERQSLTIHPEQVRQGKLTHAAD